MVVTKEVTPNQQQAGMSEMMGGARTPVVRASARIDPPTPGALAKFLEITGSSMAVSVDLFSISSAEFGLPWLSLL